MPLKTDLKFSVILFVYNLVMLAVLCSLAPIWLPLSTRREKRRRTFFKRLFMERIPSKKGGRLHVAGSERIWIHALSVGEVLSAEPLVQAMAREFGRDNLVFTASTFTGFQTAASVIAPHVSTLRYFPYDTIFSVNRALAVMRPRQVVIVETDIWPNFLFAMKKRNIPVYLVNARLSDRSYGGYRRIDFLMKPLLSLFRHVCVQTDADRRRFRDLGVCERRLTKAGNIKFDMAPLDVSSDEIMRLSKRLSLPIGRPVWVAGSTHDGEEDILADAYRMIGEAHVSPSLIVAPRDPNRAEDVRRCFSRHGIEASTLAQIEKGPGIRPVVVIDRIGMLRQLYALADVAFVGGSLVKAGGHNPLEPASLAKPILFGPHTDDFRWISRTLEDSGGAVRVFNADQIARTVRDLIKDKVSNKRIGEHAQAVFHLHQGAVERTLAVFRQNNRAGD